jgi:hypothetical protein
MKISLWFSVVAFTIGSVFDVATTVLGIADILGNELEAWILGGAVAIVVLVLNSQVRDAYIEKQWWLLPLCVLALVFDFYTSIKGGQYLPSNTQGIVVNTPLGWITLAFIAFFFVASPVLLIDSAQKLGSDESKI